MLEKKKIPELRKTSPANHFVAWRTQEACGVGIAPHLYSDHLFVKCLSLSLSLSQLYLSFDTPESKCAPEEVEGPAATELVKEKLCESEEDSLVEEDFDLKENSFLLKKTQGTYSGHIELEAGQIIPRARVGHQLDGRFPTRRARPNWP